MRKKVLFLCTGNSARSQMAEGLLRSVAEDRFEVFSAGTLAKGLHPLAVEAMRDLGIDISLQFSKEVRTFDGQHFDYVITVCDHARQACPVFPGAAPIHWGLEDPAEATGTHDEQLKTFERVRDEILKRVRGFLSSDRD